MSLRSRSAEDGGCPVRTRWVMRAGGFGSGDAGNGGWASRIEGGCFFSISSLSLFIFFSVLQLGVWQYPWLDGGDGRGSATRVERTPTTRTVFGVMGLRTVCDWVLGCDGWAEMGRIGEVRNLRNGYGLEVEDKGTG
ncbi:hypothetical protein M0R45_030952 [Rubus argutus]|uniref:Uncharacterized protein n=1 Tax=Rubus argutus TaxID=59490 RepID=A0AAW1WC71_RUBAR